jgi:hypothetical protein
MIGGDRQPRVLRNAAGQGEACETIGESRLADAFQPREQPGVM